MKVTKLLTSVAALVLVLSLGACEEVGDATLEEEGSTSSESTPSTGDGGGITSTGANGVTEILDDIYQNNNYRLDLNYYEIYSSYFSSYEALLNGYQNTLDYVDYYISFTYTEDAVLMEYYISYSAYSTYDVFDVELYVNDYENNKTLVYWLETYGDGLEYIDSYTGTWQQNLYSLIQLVSYEQYFVEGETTIDATYGTAVDYTLDYLHVSNLLATLVYSMFYGGNWFAYYGYAFGPSAILSLEQNGYATDVIFQSTLYTDLDMWVTELGSDTQVWHDDTNGYWVEQDEMTAIVYDVGNASIPGTYNQYLII